MAQGNSHNAAVPFSARPIRGFRNGQVFRVALGGILLIALIAAMSENRVIGREGKIPWSLPADQQQFRRLTWGHTVVMGRRTFEEIGKPLPGRKTILISRTLAVQTERCTTVASLPEALAAAGQETEIFIAGGSRVYEEALPYADRIYLTVLHEYVGGDTFFPDFSNTGFEKIRTKTYLGTPSYTRELYEKTGDCLAFTLTKRCKLG